MMKQITTKYRVSRGLCVLAILLSPSLAVGATHVTASINTNTTWTLAGSPYLLDSSVTVGSSATLTIEPGVVVKFNGQFRTLTIQGILTAAGDTSNRIVFTSIQDDSVGGDDNGDGGATSGAAGQWYNLSISGGYGYFNYVDIRNGGLGSTNTSYGEVRVQSGGSADFDHSTIKASQRSGILFTSGTEGSVAHTEFSGNAIGLTAFNTELTVQGNSKFKTNSYAGIFLNYTSSYAGAQPTISHSQIEDNTSYGLYYAVESALGASYVPVGHYNNFINNAGGADAKQLFSAQSVPHADWSNNYWGAAVYQIPCPFSSGTTTEMHMSYSSNIDYCQPPNPGPVYWVQFVVPGTCGPQHTGPFKCAVDLVDQTSWSNDPIDNSAE